MKIGVQVGQSWRAATTCSAMARAARALPRVPGRGFDFVSWGHHWLIDPFQHFQPIPVLARFAAEAGDRTW